MAAYKVYKGHNSPFTVEITTIDGRKYSTEQMAAISRCFIKYIASSTADAEYADSVANPECFNWTTYAATGKILIDIGLLTLTAGKDTKAELVVYDTTYTDGRVIAQMTLTVSEEVYDGVTTLGSLALPKTVTDDYQVLVTDLYRPSIRVNAATLKTLTMPVMTAAYDGARITVIIKGLGDVDIIAADGETTTFGSATHTKLTGTEQFSSVTLEYDYASDMFHIIDGTKTWRGGAA